MTDDALFTASQHLHLDALCSMMPREGRYYVEYLGWKETRGLHGNDYTDPVVKKLYSRRQSEGGMHRMTIKITRDDLQISQHKTGSNGKTSKIKYPAQPMCDVSYVAQCSPPYTDVVGCIFLGYNMYTHCAAHVHGYRFDSPDTAAMFAKQVNSIIAQSEYRQRIMAMEQDLSQLGHVNARTNGHGGHDMIGSDAGSYGSHSPISSDSGVPHEVSYPTAEEALKARKDIVIKRSASQKKQQSPKLFSTLQDELSHKLSMQEQKETPILLPPKDYDTIVRRYGHLSIRAKVKQRSIVGADSIFRSTIPESSSASSDGNNNKDAQTRKVGSTSEHL